MGSRPKTGIYPHPRLYPHNFRCYPWISPDGFNWPKIKAPRGNPNPLTVEEYSSPRAQILGNLLTKPKCGSLQTP